MKLTVYDIFLFTNITFFSYFKTSFLPRFKKNSQNMIDLDQMPPDWEFAQNHAKAVKPGIVKNIHT